MSKDSSKPKNKLLILTYHAVDSRSAVTSIIPALFQSQMEMLATRNLTGISLSDAFKHLEQYGQFPGNSIVLTFDDGFLSLIDNVMPITRALGFSGTAFIITDMIGMDAAEAGAINNDVDRDMLNWQQIEMLIHSGFEIGSHTLSHARLTQLSETAIEHELGDSRQRLQERLQVPVESFAYPYGSLNKTVRDQVARHYKHACTTRLGRCTNDPDPLELKRVDAYYFRNPKTFARLCDGKLEAYLQFRQYLRQVKQIVN